MTYTVNLLPKAEDELYAAIRWYEKEQPGLGDRFENEFLRKVTLIQNNPLHYPIKKGFHETTTEVFPFLIVYKVDERRGVINIASVFHTSRHPKRKRR